MYNELLFKEDIDLIVKKYGLKGHLLLYIDDGKIKFAGNVGMEALAPYLVKAFADKFK